MTSSTTRVSAGIRGRDRPTYLSCSPVTSTSASRSSSAAFFCMVFPMPSISLLTQETHTRSGVVTEQPHIHRCIDQKENLMLHSIIAKGCRLHAQTQGTGGEWVEKQRHTCIHALMISQINNAANTICFFPTYPSSTIESCNVSLSVIPLDA